MRVLHITNNYPTIKLPIFGIFVKEQIESLNKKNISNDLLFINGREKGKTEYFKSIFRIREKLNRVDYDLIHCHHALSSLCLILSGKSIKKVVVVSFQNDPANELGKIVFKFIKALTSAWIFKNNSSLINDPFSFYLPNGVNTNFFKPMDKQACRNHLNLDPSAIYILFVSSNRIRKQKRYDLFSKTIQILKTEYKLSKIKEIKLVNTNRDNIPYYFNAADLHLLTSDFEGSPNSVKESMACNTPVVSTNVGNSMELLEDVRGSYVSKSSNPKELAFLVNKALNENSNNGLDKITNLGLDIDSVALKLKNIYLKLTN